MYLLALKCTLKMVKMVNVLLRVFYHKKTHTQEAYRQPKVMLFYKKKIISRRIRMLLIVGQHTLSPGENL